MPYASELIEIHKMMLSSVHWNIGRMYDQSAVGPKTWIFIQWRNPHEICVSVNKFIKETFYHRNSWKFKCLAICTERIVPWTYYIHSKKKISPFRQFDMKRGPYELLGLQVLGQFLLLKHPLHSRISMSVWHHYRRNIRFNVNDDVVLIKCRYIDQKSIRDQHCCS